MSQEDLIKLVLMLIGSGVFFSVGFIMMKKWETPKDKGALEKKN